METRLFNDRDSWNLWVAETPAGNILQSYEWGELKASFGWKVLRIGISDERGICGGAQVLLRRLPIGTIAYCPRGPIVRHDDDSLVPKLFEALHRIVRDEGASFLKVEPPVIDSENFERTLRRLGFRQSEEIQPRSTIIVDLTPDLETIKARLNIKTRYNIGLASRRNVKILEGRDDDIALFYSLLRRTSERSDFLIHSKDYYERVWQHLRPKGMAHLLLASCDGEIVAGTMLFFIGSHAYYMYGASSGKCRNLKPSDLLQWESIKWAKSVGCTSYDMWGIPDEVGKLPGDEGESHLNGNGHNGNRAEGNAPRGDSILKIDRNGHNGYNGGNANGNGQDRGKDDGKGYNRGSIDSNGQAASSPLWGVYLFKRGFGGQVVRYAGAFDYVYSPAQYWLWTKALPFQRQLFGKFKKHQSSKAS
ncbi:MAG: peptidoglycan bridge formation glycyltransferase FemA/FemB family protein [Chloroflexi bacterium]|nr:peptidoglycan bridge formation glycyltransferase FemA/FemB family protein [Chloroflexota bacterium]